MKLKHPVLPIALALVACAGEYPEPKQARADTEGAIRAANEVGADRIPQANLHLKYARDQVAEAKRLMADGEYRRADLALTRARADAELALALTKADVARMDADKAIALVNQTHKQLGK